MQMKFKLKMLLIQILTIIPFLIMIFFLIDHWYDARRSLILSQNMDYAKLAAGYVGQYLKSSQTMAESLSKNAEFSDNLTHKPDNARYLLHQLVASSDSIDSITVTDNTGHALISTINLTDEQKDITITDRPYFQEILNTKATTFSKPSYSKFTGKYVAIAGAPVMADSEIRAVVNIYVNLYGLQQKLSDSTNLSDRSLVLLDRSGNVIFITGRGLVKEEDKSALNGNKFVADSIAGKSVLWENEMISLLENKLYMGAVSPVPENGWSVVSAQPIEAVYAPITRLQQTVWLMLIVAVIFSFSIFSYFLRKIRLVF